MADQPKFAISAAAALADMHPQTLRQYDRLGLVAPKRTKGGGRRYSLADVARLREIQHLSQDEGINLAGIRRIMELSDQVRRLQHQVAQLRIGHALGAQHGATYSGGIPGARPGRGRVFTADAQGAVQAPHGRVLVDQNYEWRNLPTSVLRLMAKKTTFSSDF